MIYGPSAKRAGDKSTGKNENRSERNKAKTKTYKVMAIESFLNLAFSSLMGAPAKRTTSLETTSVTAVVEGKAFPNTTRSSYSVARHTRPSTRRCGTWGQRYGHTVYS